MYNINFQGCFPTFVCICECRSFKRLTEKVKKITLPKRRISDHTRKHDFSVTGSSCGNYQAIQKATMSPWLLSGNCPLTQTENIRPSEALTGQSIKTAWNHWLDSGLRLLGITFHQDPSSRGLKSAVCVSKMMSCGRMIKKKILCLVTKVLTVTS
jgi:hypothetical protein